METVTRYDVIVIGGGVVGSLTARELTRLGARVLVLEAKSDVASGTTAAN
ncbi:MAG: FAD-binding oxidoreductase, partial [Clostridia bacterium]|nr:FAD-binding oxidoreductase [Clostridia bacterium]